LCELPESPAALLDLAGNYRTATAAIEYQQIISIDVSGFPWASQLRFLGRLAVEFIGQVIEFIGRGSWIRTNDLQYPKLPRYQAALYPDFLAGDVDTRLNRRQQGAAGRSKATFNAR
jgi:hypothetical protein